MSAAYEKAAALLTGQGAAFNPAQGAAVAEQAAHSGDPACAAIMANLAGAGFGAPQSWNTALDWLAHAAELGHDHARAQLALLSGMVGSIAAMRENVDVQAWVAARPTQLLLARPRIGTARGFLESPLCTWLKQRAEPLQAPARVYNPNTGQPMHHDVRSNTTALFTILETDLPLLMVRRRIAETLAVPPLHLERTSIFRYEPGQRFTRHVDYLDPQQTHYREQIAVHGQRVLTFLVYLNEDFDGGETTFLLIGRKFRGRSGDAVFFYNVGETGDPDQLTAHEGSPPTGGQKWLLSQFIRNKPQAPG